MNIDKFALNMCGVHDPDVFNESNCRFIRSSRRVYIGHEYCSAFLPLFTAKAETLINTIERHRKVTVCIPVVQEKHWEYLKQLCRLLQKSDIVDEIVVNDFGTLSYCHQELPDKKLILGKMFSKSPRDPRVDLWNFEGIKRPEILAESIFETESFQELMQTYSIDMVETDCISEEYVQLLLKENRNYMIHIHYPYTYITSGTVCPQNQLEKCDSVLRQCQPTCECTCADSSILLYHPALIYNVVNCGNAYLYCSKFELPSDRVLENKKIRFVINKQITDDSIDRLTSTI